MVLHLMLLLLLLVRYVVQVAELMLGANHRMVVLFNHVVKVLLLR